MIILFYLILILVSPEDSLRNDAWRRLHLQAL